MTREHVKCLISFSGGMAERLNAPVLKTGRVLTGSRGFESHSLRSLFLIDVWESRILRYIWGLSVREDYKMPKGGMSLISSV